MDANRRKFLKGIGLGLTFPYLESLHAQDKDFELLDISRAQWNSRQTLKRLCLGSCNNETARKNFGA